MKTAILILALALSGCATQPSTPDQFELGLRLLEMGRAKPLQPMPGFTCRTYWHNGYARTVCE